MFVNVNSFLNSVYIVWFVSVFLIGDYCMIIFFLLFLAPPSYTSCISCVSLISYTSCISGYSYYSYYSGYYGYSYTISYYILF